MHRVWGTGDAPQPAHRTSHRERFSNVGVPRSLPEGDEADKPPASPGVMAHLITELKSRLAYRRSMGWVTGSPADSP